MKKFTLIATAWLLIFAQSAGATTAQPSISIDTINSTAAPFDFSCPDRPLTSPVSIKGSGSGPEPVGQIEQYQVQVDWGDGIVEDASSAQFTPRNSSFTFSFAAGPHDYPSQEQTTIQVMLYHTQPPGQDYQKVTDAEFAVLICPAIEEPKEEEPEKDLREVNSPPAPSDDADSDGLPNTWESRYELNPNDPADARTDFDNDGLSNLQEYQSEANPTMADTDADGLPDKWEYDHGTLIAVSDANQDADGDGLTNWQEYKNVCGPDKFWWWLIAALVGFGLGFKLGRMKKSRRA